MENEETEQLRRSLQAAVQAANLAPDPSRSGDFDVWVKTGEWPEVPDSYGGPQPDASTSPRPNDRTKTEGAEPMKRTIHDTPQRVSYDGQFGTVTGYTGHIVRRAWDVEPIGGRRELLPDVIYDVEWLIGGTDEITGAHLVEVSEAAYAAEVADFKMWQASHAEDEAPEALGVDR